jgi:hypothetical protein
VLNHVVGCTVGYARVPKEADLELAALWANDGRDKQRKKQSVDDVTALRDGEDLQSCAGLGTHN